MLIFIRFALQRSAIDGAVRGRVVTAEMLVKFLGLAKHTRYIRAVGDPQPRAEYLFTLRLARTFRLKFSMNVGSSFASATYDGIA